MSHQIVIYTKSYCGYCRLAMGLLDRKGVVYEKRDVQTEETFLQEMHVRSKGQKKVPQIFIEEMHVGGYEELVALDRAGKLDPLLVPFKK